MSKIEVNAIEPQCGTNLTVGASGDTITFPSGTTVVNNGSQTGFGRTGTVDWDTTPKTGDFTAANGVGYFVNTAGGAVTVTLPGSPNAGDVVSVSDYNGNAQTNVITIARNSSNINGSASDLVVSKSNSAIQLIYVDSTTGWQSVITANISDISNPFISATGGTITTCGDCKIHTFTGPGTFAVVAGGCAANNVVSHLVVAGGGSGGTNLGGGGGGGGFREVKTPLNPYTSSPLDGYPTASNRVTVTTTSFPITVGAGGVGAPYGSVAGDGSNSIFSTITSTGGGGGGGSNPNVSVGSPGGSGGGGSYEGGGAPGGTGNTPPVSPPQGTNGGTGLEGPPIWSAAGGGGATDTGTNAPPSGGGPGGDGATTSISGSPTTYAGGGGGSGSSNNGSPGGTGGPGGGGGGGAGPESPMGSVGAVNTGGGGGGSANVTPPAQTSGNNGGSGIVIIRYKFQ